MIGRVNAVRLENRAAVEPREEINGQEEKVAVTVAGQ